MSAEIVETGGRAAPDNTLVRVVGKLPDSHALDLIIRAGDSRIVANIITIMDHHSATILSERTLQLVCHLIRVVTTAALIEPRKGTLLLGN